MNEKLIKYTWVEFLKTPFSLIFFAVCIVLGYIIYYIGENKDKDIESKDNQIKEKDKKIEDCMDKRIEDNKTYKALIDNMEINNKLKQE